MMSDLFQMILQLGSIMLPGLLIADMLSRFIQRPLINGFLDRLLLGFVLWNFVLTAPIVLLSMVGYDFRPYYLIFRAFSLVVVFSWLIVSARRLKDLVHILDARTSVLARRIRYHHLLILLVFLFLVSIYHPIMIEWDTVSDYLPSAKSLALTGNLFNIYRMSNSSFLNGFSVQIMYSYFYYFDASTGLRLIPFFFFLMTTISVYVFAKESKIVNNPILPVCILSTFPVTWKILAEKSLYLEIPFVFYTAAAFLLCYRALKKPTLANYLLFGASIFNLVLSKELGFFTASLFLAIIFANMLNHLHAFSRIFFILTFTSMFNVLFFIDISGENSNFAVAREILVTLFSLGILLLSEGMLKAQESSQNAKPRSSFNKALKLSALSLFLLLLLLFTLKNFFTIGLFTYDTGPAYGEYARFTAPLNIGSGWSKIFSMLSAYHLLTASGLISIYLPFFIAGIWISVKGRRDHGHSFLVVTFLYILLMWATITLSASSGDDFRRLYYFGPVVSIIVTSGFESIFRKHERTLSDLFILFNSALMLALVYVFLEGDYLKALFWRFDVFEKISPVSLFIGLLLALPLIVTLKSSKLKTLHTHIRKKHITFVLLALQLLLATSLLQPIIAYTNQYGYDPKTYDQMQQDIVYNIKQQGIGYNIFEVVNYLNRLNNSYSMVSLFGHYIPFYTNRTSIELTSHVGYLTLKSLLSQKDYLQMLELKRVKYLLLPRQGFPERIENLKNLYISAFPNFDDLLSHDSFPIRVFQHFTLYETMYKGEISTLVDYDAQARRFINHSEPVSDLLNEKGVTVIRGYNFTSTNEPISSFALKIRARAINFGLASWNTHRLIFGYQNYTRFFNLYLSMSGNIVLAEKKGEWSTLVEAHTKLNPYEWHDWSILYRNGKLTVILDDTYEIVQDQPIQITGKIGFLEEDNSSSEVSQLLLSVYKTEAEHKT